MFIGTKFVITEHVRPSKLGTNHTYRRKKTIIILRCDCCGTEFERNKGSMDHNRLNNNFYHVCDKCDIKRFAQEKGVEQRKIWDMPVSSLKQLGNYK